LAFNTFFFMRTYLQIAWHSTAIKKSLYSMLGVDVGRADAGRTQRLELVRSTMLACLEHLDGKDVPALHGRMAYAKDVQALWYLRSDLMGVLANRRGEAAAWAQLRDLTPLFQGLLPKGLISRSSPLR
jgi:hypothetical protein